MTTLILQLIINIVVSVIVVRAIQSHAEKKEDDKPKCILPPPPPTTGSIGKKPPIPGDEAIYTCTATTDATEPKTARMDANATRSCGECFYGAKTADKRCFCLMNHRYISQSHFGCGKFVRRPSANERPPSLGTATTQGRKREQAKPPESVFTFRCRNCDNAVKVGENDYFCKEIRKAGAEATKCKRFRKTVILPGETNNQMEIVTYGHCERCAWYRKSGEAPLGFCARNDEFIPEANIKACFGADASAQKRYVRRYVPETEQWEYVAEKGTHE